MAIIYTYPPVTNPTGQELVVVSDVNNKNSTRLMTVAQIAAFNGGGVAGCPEFYTLTPYTRDVITGECSIDTTKEVITTCQSSFANFIFDNTGNFVLLDGGTQCYRVDVKQLYTSIIEESCINCTESGGISTWELRNCDTQTIVYSDVNVSASIGLIMSDASGNCWEILGEQQNQTPTGSIAPTAIFNFCDDCLYDGNFQYTECISGETKVLDGNYGDFITISPIVAGECWSNPLPVSLPATVGAAFADVFDDCTCSNEQIYSIDDCTTGETLTFTTETLSAGVAAASGSNLIFSITGSSTCYEAKAVAAGSPTSTITIETTYMDQTDPSADIPCICCESMVRIFSNCDETDPTMYYLDVAELGFASNQGFTTSDVFKVDLTTGATICVQPGLCAGKNASHEVSAYEQYVDCVTCDETIQIDIEYRDCNSEDEPDSWTSYPESQYSSVVANYMNANPGSTPTWNSDGTQNCIITRIANGGTGTGTSPSGITFVRVTYDGTGDFTDCDCCQSITALYEKCSNDLCLQLDEQYTIPLTLLPGGVYEQTIIIDDAAGTGNKCCYSLVNDEDCSNGLSPNVASPVPNTVVITAAVDCEDENCGN